MAGRGPAPKPAHLRQRTNKKSTAAQLVAPVNPKIRPLPDAGRNWHPETLLWWESVWRSPMSSEYVDADVAGLRRLVVLVDDCNIAENPKERKELLAEIRLQEARFGLSPQDRARLHWEIAKGEEAEQRRKRPKPSREDQKPFEDPTAYLKGLN